MTAAPTSIGALVLRYVEDRRRRHEIAAPTAQLHREVLWGFAQHVGVERDVRRIGPALVERWATSMPHVGPGTLRHRISTVRTFFRWAMARDFVTKDPTRLLGPVKEPRRLPRGLKAQQVAAVLQACPDARATLMALLGCQEGLRIGEIARLQVGDVDFAERLILVNGKGSRQRVLPLSEETVAAMRTYLAEHPARVGPLIRSYVRPHMGVSAAYVGDLLGRAMATAGVKASAHALRHTMATDALRAGAHLRDVQAALGHTNLATTERYLPWLVHDLRDAMGGRKYREPPAPSA